jgi:hypothetical protein
MFNELHAQDENGAFYIYQNDGHFDGFFYDEVQKISYSKLDTLGIEHDDFVSQEIITADSTYRIMLTAIDSVGFVQPEIRLNPQLQDCRQKGMLDYLISKDLETLRFTFSTDMPESIRPHEGDILADYDPDEGWGGKVRSVTTRADGIIVECDPLTSFKDIFERFVTVEEYEENAAGQMVRRRVAGRPELTLGDFSRKTSPRRADHSVEFDFFKFSVTGHYPLYTDASGDKNITIDATAEVATSVKAVWNFDEQNYFSVATTFDTAAKLGFTADYKFKDIFPANLDEIGKLYIPTVAPIFYVKLAPDIFFRGDCHMNFNMTTPELRGKFWIKVEMIEFKPYIYFKKLNPRDEQEQKEEEESNRWSGAVEFNGFVQLGVKEEFAFGTNKIVSWFVDGKIDATTFIGPKLSGALNLSFSNAIQDQLSVYNVAKDSKLSLNPLAVDYQSEAEVKTLFSAKKKVTLAEGSLDLFPGLNGFDIYAFPEFSLDIETGKNDAGNTTVTATVKPSRNLIWPVDYGAGIFDADNKMVDFCWGTEIGVQMYGMLEINYPKDEQFVHTFTVTGPGKYTVRPIFKIGNNDIVASPAKEFIVPELELKMYTCEFASNGGSNTIDVKTNVDKLDVSTSESWISAHYDSDKRQLIIKAGVNSSKNSRTGTVTVVASNGHTSVEQVVKVTQAGKGGNSENSKYTGVYLYYNLNYLGKDKHSYMQYVPMLQGNVVKPAACTMEGNKITATGEQRWVSTSWKSGYIEDSNGNMVEIRDTLWVESKWQFELILNDDQNEIQAGTVVKELNYVHQHLYTKETTQQESYTYGFSNLTQTSITFPVPYEDDNSWYQKTRPIGHSYGFDYETGKISDFLSVADHHFHPQDGDSETQTIGDIDTSDDWRFFIILTPPDDLVKPF